MWIWGHHWHTVSIAIIPSGLYSSTHNFCPQLYSLQGTAEENNKDRILKLPPLPNLPSYLDFGVIKCTDGSKDKN